MLNERDLERSLNSLNFSAANLVAIVIDNGNGNFLTLDDGTQIPGLSFSSIQVLINQGENFIWLLSGNVNSVGDLWRMKKFLLNNGVPEDNIVNFHMMISQDWLANLRHIEKYGAEFFATGISYTEVGMHLNFIPTCGGG